MVRAYSWTLGHGRPNHLHPFFVIDIPGDTPRILGELKIPGFSNYLHPYDGKHVIGVGRDTTLDDGRWVRKLGLKVALFDVSDVSDPKVAGEIIMGGASTSSEALWDHKAFFFDARHNMISMPVDGPYVELMGMLDPSEHGKVLEGGAYTTPYWSGFYILDVDPQNGIETRGEVSHSAVSSDMGYVSPRTFYVGDVPYTVLDNALVASDIDSLERLGFVRLLGSGLLINMWSDGAVTVFARYTSAWGIRSSNATNRTLSGAFDFNPSPGPWYVALGNTNIPWDGASFEAVWKEGGGQGAERLHCH